MQPHGPDAGQQVMLAEYAALRAEIDRRATVQWHVFALQLAAAGAIASVAVSTAANVALLVIIPVSSYMLGFRYLLHDFHIKLIHRYLRDSLSERLQGNLQWDSWKPEGFAEASDPRRFGVTSWNFWHPTRLAFEGVAVLALAAVLAASAYAWWTDPPQWIVVVGVALGWLLGTLVTTALHRAFTRAGHD
ncbi:hypothetical protein [Actinophytocola sp.]|jgi:hypothetical protein|uniref:hypothetical protein n=1 Tax=Actinophytocola sp. TaxID=1872138 RepID=UPI002ED9916A